MVAGRKTPEFKVPLKQWWVFLSPHPSSITWNEPKGSPNLECTSGVSWKAPLGALSCRSKKGALAVGGSPLFLSPLPSSPAGHQGGGRHSSTVTATVAGQTLKTLGRKTLLSDHWSSGHKNVERICPSFSFLSSLIAWPRHIVRNIQQRDFPGGPVAKTPNTEGLKFDPWTGN